jgi:hypothetical protein
MSQIETGGARGIRVPLPVTRSGFGLGTGILTTDGELPVEFLESGDRIVTLDRGAVRLARVAVCIMPAHATLWVRPVALDPPQATNSFAVSARQKILLRDWRARIIYGKRMALVEAARLVDGAHFVRMAGNAPTRLYQLVFDDGPHVLHLAGGTMLAATAQSAVNSRSQPSGS